jgi:hypothetical protein
MSEVLHLTLIHPSIHLPCLWQPWVLQWKSMIPILPIWC